MCRSWGFRFSELSELSLAWWWVYSKGQEANIWQCVLWESEHGGICLGGAGQATPKRFYPCVTTQDSYPGQNTQNTCLTNPKIHQKHGDNAQAQLNVLPCAQGLQERGVPQPCACRFPPSWMLNGHSGVLGPGRHSRGLLTSQVTG